MKKFAGAASLVAALLAAGCVSHRSVGVQVGEPRDIVWSGTVRIKGVEEVKEGTTLIIRPGTRVIFAFTDVDGNGQGDAGILVRGGKVVAVGTKNEPITFEPEERNDKPGQWGEFRIEEAVSAHFAHCRFRGGAWPVHSHFTDLFVESSLFAGNFGGVRFRGGPVRIYGSKFSGNGTAVRYYESDPEIISNVISGNGTGIFCREGSKATVARGNNFFRNLDYHIKLGELQAHDVDARFNYWGSTTAAEIEERVYDEKDVSYLGRVRYDPPEARPFPLDEVWKGLGADGEEESGPRFTQSEGRGKARLQVKGSGEYYGE